MLNSSLDPCSIIRVQTWNSNAADSSMVGEALSLDWPTATGTVVSGEVDVLCTGPTDWLVIAANPDADALLRRLTAVPIGSAFRAANVSDALKRIAIDGPESLMLMAKGCALDLHPRRFSPGSCVRTRFAGMPIIVRCIRPSTFECIVTTSYAEYLLSWLDDAALEFEIAP
jgi:sarcosine oxidase, subunit gamma